MLIKKRTCKDQSFRTLKVAKALWPNWFTLLILAVLFAHNRATEDCARWKSRSNKFRLLPTSFMHLKLEALIGGLSFEAFFTSSFTKFFVLSLIYIS